MTTGRDRPRLRGPRESSASDDLAVEAPLTLSLGGDVLAVLMHSALGLHTPELVAEAPAGGAAGRRRQPAQRLPDQ